MLSFKILPYVLMVTYNIINAKHGQSQYQMLQVS